MLSDGPAIQAEGLVRRFGTNAAVDDVLLVASYRRPDTQYFMSPSQLTRNGKGSGSGGRRW